MRIDFELKISKSFVAMCFNFSDFFKSVVISSSGIGFIRPKNIAGSAQWAEHPLSLCLSIDPSVDFCLQ